jgi:hypothetical protein
MSALPTVRSGVAALYPLTRSVGFLTTVKEFCDDSEQRWGSQLAGLAKFRLQYEKLRAPDVNALLAFWNAQKGAYDATWSFTIEGVTYSNMFFAGDAFKLTETAPGSFSLSLDCAQWRQN